MTKKTKEKICPFSMGGRCVRNHCAIFIPMEGEPEAGICSFLAMGANALEER